MSLMNTNLSLLVITEEYYQTQNHDQIAVKVKHQILTLLSIGVKDQQVHMNHMASKHCNTLMGSLVDTGTYVSIADEDVCVINKSGRQVDVQGIDNH